MQPAHSFDVPPRIRVIVAPLPGADLDPELRPFLDAAEAVRWSAYRRPDDARRFALGRALVKRSVADACGVAPSEVRVVTSSRGRPSVVLAGRPDRAGARPALDVSIAHAGGLVGVALGWSCRVGLDLEPLAAATPDLSLVATAPAERPALACLEPSLRREAALGRWVAKEAYAKLLGIGLGLDPTRVTLERIAGRRRLRLWSRRIEVAGEPYRLAIAALVARSAAPAELIAPPSIEPVGLERAA